MAKVVEDLVEQAPLMISVRDLSGRYLYVNPGFEKALGVKSDDIIGKTSSEVFPPAIVQALGGEGIGDPDPVDTEHELNLEGQQKILLSRGFLLRDREGSPVAVCTLAGDITERARDERQKLSLTERLFDAQRLNSLRNLAGGIAHDFNNLIGVILNYAQFVLDGAGGNVQVRMDAEEIRKAAERASDLTQHLLAFGGRQMGEPRNLDLNSILSELGQELHEIAGDGVEIVFDLSEGLRPVTGDRVQMERVAVNLARNAAAAMSGKGTLTIHTSNVEAAPGEADAPAAFFVLLRVSDTGSGMNPTVKAQAFEPFFTTSPARERVGLGLSTVWGVVTAAGGSIDVQSEPGQGSTFDLLFPAAQTEPPAAGGAASSRVSAGPSRHILVVDDEEAMRLLVSRILSDAGYRATTAASAGEALSILSARGDEVDLVLTDILMPGTSGIELAEQIKGLQREIRVLFMSGSARYRIANREMLEAATPLLEKPFTSDQLLAAVDEMLRNRPRVG